MANNPETYDCRVALKECFSVLSECRRVALKRLPVNFFVVMFNNLIRALINNDNSYADIVIQAWSTRKQRNYQPESQFIDATMDIFDNTLKKFNIEDPIVSKVYREFLTRTRYVDSYIYRTVLNIKHLQ